MAKMIYSRNTAHSKEVTNNPNGTSTESGQQGDGEGFGVGTKYSATLNERENKSINRNNGVERPSANTGKIDNAGIGKGSRKTGKVG